MRAPDIRDILAAPRSSRALAASGVTVRRSGRVLLDDVSATASPGRVTALVGPNGAGKSTLLAALSGDVAPEVGAVTWGGADLAATPIRERARLRAVLPQSHPATVPFTAGEVIEFGRAPWGEPDPGLRRRVIADCDVAHLLDRPVTVLSGGELARVHCARVLMQDTPVLLLDEPTAALDLRHAESVLALVTALATARHTSCAGSCPWRRRGSRGSRTDGPTSPGRTRTRLRRDCSTDRSPGTTPKRPHGCPGTSGDGAPTARTARDTRQQATPWRCQ